MLVPITPPPITTTSAALGNGAPLMAADPADCGCRAHRWTGAGRHARSSSACGRASGCPGVHNLPRVGGAARVARSGSSAYVTSRPPSTPPTATRGSTGRARRRADHHRPGRRQRARRHRRGVGVGVARAGHRHRHPDHAAPPRRLPRRAARDARPGRHVRAGGQGDDPRGRGGRDRRGGGAGRGDGAGGAGRPGLPRDPDRPPPRPAVSRVDFAVPEHGRSTRAGWTRPWNCAPRPSGRCCGSAAAPRTRGDGVAALATALGAPVIETYGARGVLDPAHPSWLGLPPHLPEVGALWDDADLVVSVGSDLDGMMTQNFAQPQPPRLVALNVDAADATKNYAADVVVEGDVGRDRRGAGGGAARREPTPPSLAALRSGALERLREDEPDGAAFLDAMDGRRSTRTPSSSPTCASPATGWRRCTRSRARGGWPTRWAGARWASPSRRRSAPRWPRTTRCCACAATAASCSRPASWPWWPRSGRR